MSNMDVNVFLEVDQIFVFDEFLVENEQCLNQYVVVCMQGECDVEVFK